jgi:hypothetical protein
MSDWDSITNDVEREYASNVMEGVPRDARGWHLEEAISIDFTEPVIVNRCRVLLETFNAAPITTKIHVEDGVR